MNDVLTEIAGQELAFILLVQADNVAQYVSNAYRPNAQALLEDLLQRWKDGRADIPAHYNPDLPR